MAQSSKSCDVIGGRIRTKCIRCEKAAYIEVVPGIRKRIVRCSCGKSTLYQVNYRKFVRESAFGKANAVFSNAKEAKIRLCDASPGGLGFIIPPDCSLSLHQGDEIRINYRTGGGALAQRKVFVKNIHGNRVGAQYA